jgi:chromosome segregation ATPase
MDEQALREQITAQIQAQFENQLREMKRQKNEAEEQFDDASDLWRAERRRLKAEIERLQDELSQGGSSLSGDRQAELAAWEEERTRLTSELKRAQSALADAIARSSNPVRPLQALREEYEIKMAETNSQRLRAEREFMRARADWESEKARLMRELKELQQLVSDIPNLNISTRRHYVSESAADARIRELETQLSEARTTILRSNETASVATKDLAAARREAAKLSSALAEIPGPADSRAVEQLRREYEAKIQDLAQEKDRLMQQLAALRAEGQEHDRSTPGPPEASAATGADSIDAEARRVEASIAAIEKLFDEPDTTASVIARKKAERAELEAYRRGLVFQADAAR